MKRRFVVFTRRLSLLLVLCCGPGHAVMWFPFGPYGGDARALVADPHQSNHMYLGTAIGLIFESQDGGKSWKRLPRVGKRDDLVLDNIIVDTKNSRHLVVGAWVLGNADGGLYVSNDGGQSWKSSAEMEGQSIRALAASASDPKTLVAGTLKGVYRSTDGGTRWELISPEGSKEIHEVESIAIDPGDARIIYAGTWHLPWKTIDGGHHWNSIKEGVIEDSDVFSIIVDPKEPKVVYASACTGIYKSENGGGRFTKVQGIPSTARRTRVLMQDPNHLETVYAGTTEGLWRTDDAGANWVRTTGPELIVNDVYVDPADSTHVLIATDRGGVLTSHDRGNSFDPSNSGFTSRQITSFLTEERRPAYAYVGIVNDKEWGGVFASENGGLSWVQESAGLGGRDVFSLVQAPDGTILAGTGHGIYRLNGAVWARVGAKAPKVATAVAAPVPAKSKISQKYANAGLKGKQPVPVKEPSAPRVEEHPIEGFDGSVYGMARLGERLYAATSDGLLTSINSGERWSRVPGIDRQEMQFVSVAKNTIVAAGLKRAVRSGDGGKSWAELKLPENLTQIGAIAVDGSGAVWVGGREGVYASFDGRGSWVTLKSLYIRNVNSISYDEANEQMLVTASGDSTMAFAVHLPDRTVRFWDTGWNLRFVRTVGDHLIAVTPFDGIVVQPRMVDSAEVPKPQSGPKQDDAGRDATRTAARE